MKNKTIIILCMVLLIIIPFVNSSIIVPEIVIAYYSLNQNYTDIRENYDITNTGTNIIQNGTCAGLSGCAQFGDDADKLNANTLMANLSTHGQGSVSGWFYKYSKDDSTFVEVSQNPITNNQYIRLVYDDFGGEFVQAAAQTSGSKDWERKGNDISIGTWHHFILQSDGSEVTNYLDCVVQPTNVTNDATVWWDDLASPDLVQFGEQSNNVFHLHGLMDELLFTNRELNQTEREYLCGGVNLTTETFFPGGAPPVASKFIINCFDYYNNNSVNVCNATINSTTYYTINGTISTPLNNNNSLADITVESNESGGYFPNLWNDYNLSIDLNSYNYQSIITYNGVEQFTGNTVNNFAINHTPTGTGNNRNTSNATITFNLNATNLTTTATSTGYITQTFNLSLNALDNVSNQINFSNANATFNLRKYDNTEGVKNYNLTITSSYYSYSETFINGTNSTTILLMNGTYNLTIVAPNYANTTILINVTNGTASYNIFIFTRNSINFSFFLGASSTPYTDVVNLTLTGGTITYNFNNITGGTYYADFLNDDTYNIFAYFENDDGERIFESLFLTVGGASHHNIKFFMNLNKAPKTFLTLDRRTNEPVENVILTFSQLINGSYIAVGQVISDFSGASLIYLDETISYSFTATHENYQVFSGNVTPIFSVYTIDLSLIGTTAYTPVFEHILLRTLFERENNFTWGISTLEITSIKLPSLFEYYGMNITYNSVNYFINQTGNPAGGTETINVTNINISLQDYITIQYFFKATDYDYHTWTETYSLIDYIAGDTAIEGGLFSDITLDAAGKAILAFFLLILFITAAAGFSRNLTIGAITGIIFTGVFSIPSVGLLPLRYSIITIIVLIILIIGDNATGGR